MSLPFRVLASPNAEPRRDGKAVDMLILHYTAMDSAEKACRWLCMEESKVSCHYLVDEAGGIVNMVDEELRAWHAGVSFWQGETDINSRSIGIEIQNPGPPGGYPDFPLEQMSAVARLSRAICERHAIPPARVLAHSDVAPGRKIDPGEKFDWAYLHARGVGHWVAPSLALPGAMLGPGCFGPEVSGLQAMLARYGYGIAETGHYDALTGTVVSAFQRHFRQYRVDGIADTATVETLQRLIRELPAPAAFTASRTPA